MLIAFVSSLFSRRAYAWRPAIEIRDGATAATLEFYTRS